EIESTLLLVGDAGGPAAGEEPVLSALRTEAARNSRRTVIVFLGDNVYPAGLPDSTSPGRAEAERRLVAQLDVSRSTGARAIFIPGNHDWAKHSAAGWAAIRRQGRFIRDVGGPLARLVPEEGCPGPAVVDVTVRLRLIALDTQWWLQNGPKPHDPTSSCPADSEREVEDSLAAALRAGADRHVIVVAHHPLVSAGPHGGRFTLRDHLFPLRALAAWLWLPLPILGSLYPLARLSGISPQDMSSPENRRMRAALKRALSEHPPLLYAAGHDHNLQVIKGSSARYLVVSGAGIYGHQSSVGWRPRTTFAEAASGFVRVDLLKNGRVRLAVLIVERTGRSKERYSIWLN
ncbi:MAG: metallophosphoesterase, partial [Chloroflexota bacterium]|nr:metallophosphoesterase [Chloroflexota bacterium]